MSLYNTINRASGEALETQTKKALAKKVKDGQVLLTLKSKIRDALIDYTIEELETDDVKDLIIERVLNDLYNDDFFNSHLEADAYYYSIFEKYDVLVNKLKKNKELEEKQLKTLKEKEEKELEEKHKKYRENINEILKGLFIGLLIIFFPFVFIAFVIYQILKEMK